METKESYPSVYAAFCPTRQILDRIADKWTFLIIGTLQKGTCRFSELRRTVEGISQKMLTQTLRELERDGLVERTVYAQVPPKVEYALTPLGRTLCEPLGTITKWAEEHIQQIDTARAAFDARPHSNGTFSKT